MRWLLLDEIIGIEKGRSAKTRSRVPDLEASAEVLMIEMMAQTGGLLLGAESDYRDNLIFAKIENAEFSGNYKAGDAIEIRVSSESLKPEGSWIDGLILREAETVASARFLLMNAGEIVPGRTRSITFHEGFMNHFKVLEKIR